MATEIKQLWEFGRFRLDTVRKTLWHDGETVPMPLKELELLCKLVDRHGELVTKDELLESIWAGSFVEESNLSRHVYLLRKTLRELGESEDLIQNVPRRGYRFTGEVHENQSGNADLVIERHVLTRTLVEDISAAENGHPTTENEKAVRENIKADQQARTIASPHVFFRPKALSLAIVSLLILAAGFAFWRNRTAARTSPAEIRSLAVLPFKTVGTKSGEEHLGLGLADVLITRLSNIRELNVRPTSSVMAFDGQVQDSISAGRKLNVDAVLEGTVYHADGRVRVTARLLRVDDQTHLWAGQFEKPLQDELKVQDEIALQLVDALSLTLSGTEKTALTKRFTESADAYQLYLKGRYHWNKRSHEGMIEAQRLFRNAIEKDSHFTLAFVGLADTLATSDARGEAYNAVLKALELEPNLAEAHATLGFIKMFHEWSWREAETAFKKSIELNPGYATAYHWYATLLAIEGRNKEAKAAMRRALEINPISHNFLADMGQLHYFGREYEEAKEYCRLALEIDPEFSFAHQYLYYTYLKTGEYDKAVEELIIADRINGNYANQSDARKHQSETSFNKQREAFREGGISGFIESRLADAPQDVNRYYNNAMLHTYLGEKEKALSNLERACQGRVFLAAFVKADPIFDSLRSEPRYQAILKKMVL